MPTYRLTVEYDGTDFHGWQVQPDVRTVAATLLQAVHRLTGEHARLTAAGRTDSGAHAHGQVAGIELEQIWEPARLQAGLNALLPADVVVVGAELRAAGFHARRDAVSRTYRYVVVSRAGRAAITRRHAWTVRGPLDVAAMRAAAVELVGTHDFVAFGRAPAPGGTTVRTVHEVRVDGFALGDDAGSVDGVVITVRADAFLRGMMRAVASALVAAGQGRRPPLWVRDLINGPVSTAPPVQPAPAHGLHQWAVEYPWETMATKGCRMTQVTFQAKPGALETRWYLVDARGQTLGRLAVNIARVLRGKHRPQFTTHVNTGEHVIVINARDIVVTGRKRSLKIYDRYSGYPSGRRERTYDEAVQRDPTFPLTHAIRGMLQHNTLGAEQLKRLRVYPGPEHPHEAQRPQKIAFGELGEIVAGNN